LAGIAVIRQAIAEGFRTYDLLRGDEPYKAHWRAVPTPMEQWTIVNPRWSSRARYAARRTYRRLKAIVRGDGRPTIGRSSAIGGSVAPISKPADESADVALRPIAVDESPEPAVRVFVP
jgi:hypothetical protein